MLIMFCGLIPQMILSVHATNSNDTNSSVGITRAQWIQALVDTFDMTVEGENYPDNYYTDISEEDSFYRDVLVAVEFGVIQLEVGSEFRPNDPATREFAAQTLNFCLAYQLDEDYDYTFTDVAAVTYAIDAQVALNRGWFKLIDGAFKPDLAITSAEKDLMLKDAAAILNGSIIDENYSSTYGFAKEIIIIPEGTNVNKTDENIITIENSPEVIKNGDFFAVYLNGIPCAYSADSVETTDNHYVIHVTQLTDEEAYTSIDAEGVVYATFTQIEAEEGTEIIYVIDQTGEEYTDPYAAEAAVYALKTKSTVKIDRKIKTATKIDVGNGLSVSVSTEIKNPKIKYSINLAAMTAYVSFEGDADVSYEVEFDLAEAGSDIIDLTDVRLLNCTIPHVGGLVISLDVELSGAIKGTNSGHLVAGYQYDPVNGGRIIKDFQARSFALEAEASGKLGIGVKVGLTDLPVVKGYLFAGTGAKGSLKVTTHLTDDFDMLECRHFAAYWYVEYGAKAEINFFKFKKTFEDKTQFFGESNSPIRVVHHYENGVEVPGCTRDGSSYSNGYYTSGYSSYWGSGWSGGTGGSGYDRNGNPIVIYQYSLDEDNNATITGYSGNANALVIPGTIDGYKVIAIGDNVFKGRTSLYSVTIPTGVSSIGGSAFRNCNGLRNVTFPDTLKNIGGSAFEDCYSLISVELPDSMEILGCGAFRNCIGLQTVYIPANMDAGAYAGANYMYPGPFYECSNLKNISFGDGITYIPSAMFYGCTGLTNIEIPESVTKINEKAFYDCTNLESIMLSKNLKSIDGNAFSNCFALTEIILPDSMEVLGCGAFRNCIGLQTVYIPANMDAGAYAGANYMYPGPFYECSNLKNISFGDGTTYIPSGMFYGCTGLVSVKIPETVTRIKEKAFLDCTKLESVMLSEALTTIESYAFSNCSDLAEIELPMSMNNLGYGAFSNCTSLEEINIPKNMKTGNYAGENNSYPGPFRNCSNLKNVTFEEGIEEIPRALFWNCSGLQCIDIPSTVTSINYRAFAGCTNLKSTAIPVSVTKIGGRAFSSTGLDTIAIPETVTEIGNNIFEGCNSLTTVEWPSSLPVIKDYTFSGCTSLTTVNMPDTVTTLNTATFKNCDSLQNILLSEKVTKIGNEAFYDCDALKAIEIPYGVTKIGEKVFYDCDALESVKMSNAVTSIGSNIFYHCDVLKDVTLSRNLTTIPSGAFRECALLDEIVIPYYTTTIKENAFDASSKLAKVVTYNNLSNIASNAFSYPKVTVFYGTAGSYTQTWASENGYTFIENTESATKITLADTEIEIAKGDTYILDFDIEPIDFAEIITFKSGNSSVVTISDSGKLTAVGVGTATIKIMAGDVSASCKVTVTQDITKITLDNSKLSLDVPNTYQMTANIRPTDASNQNLKWTSSNEKAATVSNNGLVTAIGNGTAIITATTMDGTELSASCTVTVIEPDNIPVNSIVLDKSELSLNALDTYQLSAIVLPEDAANKNLIWTSSDATIATVDENGFVTAIAKGDVVITAAAADESGISASCTINVLNTAYVVTDTDGFESSHNYTNNCSDCWIYSDESAENIRITFDAQTEMEDSFDYLYIYSYSNNGLSWELVGKYSGKELSGQTIEIAGNAVKIQLKTDDSGNEWGFKVTNIEKIVTPSTPKFEDVVAGSYYEQPVQWAVENGITNGYGSDTIFNPEGTCTRGQIVTFLWRANGSPEPASLDNPFTDVPDNEYYYKAVLWAVENGITAGYGSDTIFNPDGACTRAQVATFMWRAAGKPDMSDAANPFTDLEEGSFYYDAVLWAVENGITNGYGSAETFCPDITCTRGQIVTFLYRGMN